jgi:transcriptional regulator with XRE-family HTH domain
LAANAGFLGDGANDEKRTPDMILEGTHMPRKFRKIVSLHGGSTTINRATETDRYVGGRIRERRIMLGLSQQQMADMIGVTYQQTHKYERGINRISAGRLYEIAQVLRVPLSFFFEGLGDRPGGGALTGRQRMCLELARNFAQITNGRHQEALSQLARTLARE